MLANLTGLVAGELQTKQQTVGPSNVQLSRALICLEDRHWASKPLRRDLEGLPISVQGSSRSRLLQRKEIS